MCRRMWQRQRASLPATQCPACPVPASLGVPVQIYIQIIIHALQCHGFTSGFRSFPHASCLRVCEFLGTSQGSTPHATHSETKLVYSVTARVCAYIRRCLPTMSVLVCWKVR